MIERTQTSGGLNSRVKAVETDLDKFQAVIEVLEERNKKLQEVLDECKARLDEIES